MAKRAINYIVRRIGQIAIFSLGTLIFTGLCLTSITQAGSEEEAKKAPTPAETMRTLMTPEPADRCKEDEPPPVSKCPIIFNIDNEVTLQNLVQNYTACMEGYPPIPLSFYNKEIVLSKTLKIYSRGKRPLTIRGLKLIPDKSFSKADPAIMIYGDYIHLEDIDLEGFENGVVYCHTP